MEIRWQATVTALDGSNHAGISLLGIRFSNAGREATKATCSLLVDCVEIRYGVGWPEGESYVDPLYSPRENEYASIPILGYTYPWSMLVEWKPDINWAERETDIHIVSLMSAGGGAGAHVNIYWEASTQKFCMTQGGATVKLATATKFRYLDTIRIGISISDDGDDATLHVHDPINGTQSVAGVGYGINDGASVKFGVDSTGTLFGCGLFYSTGLRHESISDVDFVGLVSREGWHFNPPRSRLTLIGAHR
jgi:hypothetical protein